MTRVRRRIALGGGIAMLVSGAAWPDVPRLELGGGAWQHEATGTLSSDDPQLAVPPGFELSAEREPYARFGLRLGNAWWSPVVRGRYSALTTDGASFVDNSTFLGNVLLNLDTRDTRTALDFEQLEGLLYFTVGDRIRAELGGGVKKLDGSIESVEVRNTSVNGEVTTHRRRELPADIGVFYGAAYAEPFTWLSFGGEAVTGSDAGTDVFDLSFRAQVKPFAWVSFEGGYRRMTLKADDHENTAYDLEFGGPYAGLAFSYGSRDAGLLAPDTDKDGVRDTEDTCPDTPAGVAVNESGCEPDGDHDGVPDARDDCPDTPAAAAVDGKGCAAEPEPEPEPPVAAAPADADRDGLPDDTDQCPDTPEGAPVDANGCPLAAAVTEPPIPPPPPAGPDEDQDGVPDSHDRCRRTPRGFKVDATGCLVQQESVLQGITFQVNSSYLMRDSEVLLLEVVDALKADRNSRIVIQGHTCDLGDAKYNKWLSERRANRVLEFLVRHGIDRGRLLATGYGEEQPLVPNDDERMRELNRRTVFKVVQ